jgi:AraC family transcriptional regulator
MTQCLPSGQFFGKTHESIVIESARISKTFYQQGDAQPPHTHARPHLCLTADGTYEEFIGHSKYIFSRGVLTYYHPDQIHSDVHLTDGVHFIVEVDTRSDSLLETLTPQFIRDPVYSGKSLALIWRLYEEFTFRDCFSQLILQGLTLELLVESFRKQDAADSIRNRPIWLNPVLGILRSDFSTPPGLSQIANQIGIHPVHLAKTFRRFEGVTVGEYIRRLRIDAAQNKLMAGDEPIVAIALECGFSDQTHFTRVFKKLVGMTPARFRKICQR